MCLPPFSFLRPPPSHLLPPTKLSTTSISYLHRVTHHIHSLHNTVCSCVGVCSRPNLLDHVAIVENEAKERVRFNLLKKAIQPCGPPPFKAED
eukprot:m.54720 g.54720  ORF g.54720 m.54720 type:complete len:93 (-) comp7551_c0_seq2:224-502(-)